jgi:prevent-host-death family protein
MIKTSVAELKARLSHFLRRVQEGEIVEVASHRHVVARIVPSGNLGAASLVKPASRPARDVSALTGVSTRMKVDPVSVLLEDRARR